MSGTEAGATDANAVEEGAARIEAERLRRTQAEAARADQVFRNRYVNRSAVAQLDGGHVTVAVSDNGLERSIAQAFRERGVSVSTNLFTDQIFERSVLPQLAAGDRGLFGRLGLGSGRATLILGELEQEPLARTGIGNTVNLRGHLSIHVVPLWGDVPVSLPTISQVGAGFTEEQARSVLHKRLVEDLLEVRTVAELVH